MTVTAPDGERKWWKEAAVYQVYPASFADHAANGHGTLRGVCSKVPYLKELGIDVVWLSPCYESPQADMGYDISNYQKIDPQYGTLDDWDLLKDACHQRGMKLVMDLVVNHTSDQHDWFKESRTSKTHPKRDWYIWRPAKINEKGEREPPNNWRSSFGSGSAWEWDEETQEYYLHLYLKEQPDLNWECTELRQAVYTMMRWWLDRGADGFRMDVINYISKAPGLPDAPITAPGQRYQGFGGLSVNRPEVHQYLQEMHQEVLSHYDCFAVGECPGNDSPSKFAPYSIPANKELQMVFHFHHQGFDRVVRNGKRAWNPDWTLAKVKDVFNTWNVEMDKLGGWNSNYLENHDQPRIVSRLTSDHPTNRAKCAKLCSMFQTTLTGTLFIYQGEEIGMINIPEEWPASEYKDIEAVQNLEADLAALKKAGQGDDQKQKDAILQNLRMIARDNGRTPMQWDDSPNAGFSQATPWMRVPDDFTTWNAKTQMTDATSPWSFWKRMLEIRKEYPVFTYGRFTPLDVKVDECYAYTRHHAETNQKLLVLLNFARGTDRLGAELIVDVASLPAELRSAKLLVTNGEEKEGSIVGEGVIKLSAWEGRIYIP